ncbi:DUF362 domain-containing protein [Carboxylicivirga sediminis]|uniref:DUF362 domain-containing protein n=1 Tax=Carboxylicivirga sediminis TaxID=2006564 RepID=A0A941FCW8_9BACT|nr:DUF362 domain-containing protein [Carboxylicivirga sediminis]MBR8538205.1 DUF362 domain-containing protein [Carboxylicivirga sediminis]
MSQSKVNRRSFFKLATAVGAGAIVNQPQSILAAPPQEQQPAKPVTNIADALKHPRNERSLPGKYPGKVVKVMNKASVVDNQPQEDIANEMIKKAMLQLTNEENIKKAWQQFVSDDEIIGLKVNPVAGKLLSTSHAVVQSIVKQLESAGIPRKNIVIWDRRLMQLHETGFTEENYPGITITGTEQQDAEGGFYDKDGKLYGEKMIDKEWFYYADVEGEYDEYTMPYMVNGGKHSYFTKICTQQVDKIINVPILKNAGPTVTLCLKNLAYGSISNTGRLHKQLWSDTCAEVCAFPPIRDKVVLNIVDGLKGCFNGGPAANPQFICNYYTIMAGTDPVAIDRIGHDIIVKKRIAEGIQEKDDPKRLKFMEMAEELQLGVADINKITLEEV